MALTKKKKKKTPSLEERHSLANQKAAVAVSWAEDAINALEEAAEDHAVLADELSDEIDRLTTLRHKALKDFDASSDVAARIRGLVGVA